MGFENIEPVRKGFRKCPTKPGADLTEARSKEWGFRTYFPHADLFADKAKRAR
jgi:hypothetical protein